MAASGIVENPDHRKLSIQTLITALSSAVDIDSLSFTQGWYAVKSISVIMYIDFHNDIQNK